MSLLRWDPFADMSQLRDQVDHLFDQMLTRSGREPVSTHTWAPAVDIYETDGAMVLRMDVAGVSPEDIDVQLNGDTLTISGERKLDENDQGKHYVRIERQYGKFQRSFTLGLPIDPQGIRAGYHHGVLEVILPKREEVKPKQVKVEVQHGPSDAVIEAHT